MMMMTTAPAAAADDGGGGYNAITVHCSFFLRQSFFAAMAMTTTIRYFLRLLPSR